MNTIGTNSQITQQIEHKDDTINRTLTCLELQPAFSENNVAILFAANHKYLPYIAVVLQSIVAHSSPQNNYDIIIFTMDITLKNQKKLQKYFASYCNISIRFFDVTQAMQPYIEIYTLGYYYTIETYFRLLAPDILKAYDKILYLDGDILVQSDVAKLYNIELNEEYLLAACRDINWIAVYNSSKMQQKYVKEKLQLQEPQNYFQAGIILFHLKAFRESIEAKQMMEFANKENWQLLDQDVLNYVAQNRVLYLDTKWNVMYNWPKNRIKIITKYASKEDATAYIEARNHPAIIHYAGPEKPWMYEKVDFGDIWWKYAAQSIYYQELQIALVERKKLKNKLKRFIKKIAMPFVNIFFPHGSKHREKLRAIVYKKF